MSEETPTITTEFKSKMLEWQKIKKTLKEARKDVSGLKL